MQIFQAALAAVDPERLVREYLQTAAPGWVRAQPVLVIGAGKAAARMAAGCEHALGAGSVQGTVIDAPGNHPALDSITIALSSHPIPDAQSVAAAAALQHQLERHASLPVLALISGGASSLIAAPRAPLGLDDKIEVNRLLLASGADIAEVNTVRKHLSTVKGGGLLRAAAGRRVHTIIISDVVGDDPGTIGSGLTVPDRTTFADALAVLERYSLGARVPPAVRTLLQRGAAGLEAETVRPTDPSAAAADHMVIGSNRIARLAAAAEARRLGYSVAVREDPILGDSASAAREWLRTIDAAGPSCAIAGGETTVELRGDGRGGRNQEFALALVEPLAGRSIAVLSAGTDGIDGPTDAAGAFVDGDSLERVTRLGLDPAAALARNDSHTFFAALGDLLRTGPTGTNVMDLKLALHF